MRATAASVLRCFIILAVFAAAGPAVGDGVGYALEPGQKITYTSSNTQVMETATYEGGGTWTIWVAAAHPDGSRRVLVRAQSARTSIRKGQRRELWNRVWYGRFDLRPDGTYDNLLSFENAIDPGSVFVRLPAPTADPSAGWSWSSPERFTEFAARPLREQRAEGDEPFRFALDARKMTDAIYLVERNATVTFDPERGLITEIERTSRKGWGSDSNERGRLTLTSVERLTPEAMATMDREVEAYVQLADRYRKATDKSREDLSTLDARLAEAKAMLTAARDTFTVVDIRDQVDAMLKIHDPRTNYHRDVATRRADLVGKPAPDWSAPDLDGTMHALSEYRGKVVVLDFWYRGCTWCVRCMPQVKELVNTLKDEPFVFFGVNKDEDLADAHFVVDAMDLNYASLHSLSLHNDYGVRAFPTMVIIGPDGVVRSVHFGYSANLGATVLAEVRAILADG